MSIKLPEKLAEDLYYCLIANVPSNIFDQEAILQGEYLYNQIQYIYSKLWLKRPFKTIPSHTHSSILFYPLLFSICSST